MGVGGRVKPSHTARPSAVSGCAGCPRGGSQETLPATDIGSVAGGWQSAWQWAVRFALRPNRRAAARQRAGKKRKGCGEIVPAQPETGRSPDTAASGVEGVSPSAASQGCGVAEMAGA